MELTRVQYSIRIAPVLLLALVTSPLTHAAKVDTGLSLSPSVTYTDNVCLRKEDTQGDWVATVTPNATASVSNRRMKGRLNGSVSINSLTNSQLKKRGCGGRGEDRKQFQPRINGSLSTKLAGDWLNLSLSARADQNTANPRLAGGLDEFDRLGNTNTYYRYTISPSMSRTIAGAVRASLRYSYNEIYNTVNTVSDSSRETWSLSLKNKQASQLTWGLSGRSTRVEYADTLAGNPRKDTELQSARLSLGYKLNRRWQVSGSYGWEWNSFQTRSNFDNDGAAWTASIKWTPSPRTSVLVGSGDRFFGQTPRVKISHETRNGKFNAGYNKSITYDRDIRTLRDGFIPRFGTASSLQSRSPIIDERFTLGYTHRVRRIDISLAGHYSQQLRAEDDTTSDYKHVSLTVRPNLASRYSVSSTLAWNQDEPRGEIGFLGTDSSSETWLARFTLSRTLNQRMNLSLSYQYSVRDSNIETSDYQENRITAALGISL